MHIAPSGWPGTSPPSVDLVGLEPVLLRARHQVRRLGAVTVMGDLAGYVASDDEAGERWPMCRMGGLGEAEGAVGPRRLEVVVREAEAGEGGYDGMRLRLRGAGVLTSREVAMLGTVC
jgi:hypothetical protein